MGSAVHHHRGGGVGGRSWLPPLTYDPLLTSAHGPKGSAWPRSLLLVLALLFAVMGLVMIIVGSTSYHALLVRTGEGINEEEGGGGGIGKEEGIGGKEGGGGDGGIGREAGEESKGERGIGGESKGGGEITADGGRGGGGGGDVRGGNATAYVLVLCLGILLEVAALGSLWGYCRYMGYYLPCCPGKISRIRRRFHGHPTRSTMFNGQMASSGTPVSAQYCPPPSPPLVTAGAGEPGPPRALAAPPPTTTDRRWST